MFIFNYLLVYFLNKILMCACGTLSHVSDRRKAFVLQHFIVFSFYQELSKKKKMEIFIYFRKIGTLISVQNIIKDF